jgi:dGTPase
MQSGQFKDAGMFENHPHWQHCIERKSTLYRKQHDIRSEFFRDYNRILHCTAYRRLKHKTQVFFATTNDHVCTRIEHVHHVAAVSSTIANYLGLNSELTSAISIGHDIGHAPFGHQGENILKEISQKYYLDDFWHEKNSLKYVDKLETLQNALGEEYNLNLTFAVRDGILTHCGEVDFEPLFPRPEAENIEQFNQPGLKQPYTWEGCVVKLSDKIAYLGRDLEDALRYEIITKNDLLRLGLKTIGRTRTVEINTSGLIHSLVIDLAKESSPDRGLTLSKDYVELLGHLKTFSSKKIYNHPKLLSYKKYANLIIYSIFELLESFYDGPQTFIKLDKQRNFYPLLIDTYSDWLKKYCVISDELSLDDKFKNVKLYDIRKKEDYLQAIVDFISGMTDRYAIKAFTEITSF